jgi:hypothetical protein
MTLLSSVLYMVSDGIEWLGSGFAPFQLYLTYIAFVMVPFIMTGLFAIQWPKIHWIGLIGAVAFGASFVFYAGTAIYALTVQTGDYEDLVRELGLLYTLHGGLLVAGGILFGAAVIRSRILPLWTGYALTGGVVVNLVISLIGLPDSNQIVGSSIRNIAFFGMAVRVLKNSLSPTGKQ